MTTKLFTPLEAVAKKLGRLWWVLLVVGIAWIIVGFVVLRFDTQTVTVISVLFGILILLSTAGEIFRAVVTRNGWRFWHILFAVLLVIAAVIAFANPGGTFFSLALVVGFYFVFAGTFDIISSLFSVGASPAWGLQLVSGILQLLLGFIASSSLSASVVILVTYVSISALFRGVAEIAAAFTARSIYLKAKN
ncbi:MAG: hypothetical protein JWO18_2741 [Microbacteriaceae bacterium]|jgi:uncharacterized membrane protein HdeD (DUF308 family)|nr:hypothetical protein [Microbacteriaceae bacterium]